MTFQTAKGYGAVAEVTAGNKALLLGQWAKFYNQGRDGQSFFPSYDEALTEYNTNKASSKYVVLCMSA